MESRFTLGKLRVYDKIYGDNRAIGIGLVVGSDVAKVLTSKDVSDRKDDDALIYAQLFCAAPDLFEACEEALEALGQVDLVEGESHKISIPYELCKAALEKARGES